MATPVSQIDRWSEQAWTPAGPTPREDLWGLHVLALLTVLAACPLLFLGAEVTSRGVGMVDPQGFRPPWHLFVQLEQGTLLERGLGYLIEHAHRLAGFLVGTCTLLLAGSLWLWEPRRWVRGLGLIALAAVSLQGVLGIFRVDLNAWMGRDLALLHGCFAQLVFALLVSLAVITAPSWRRPLIVRATAVSKKKLHRSAWLLVGLIALQLILGAWIRHKDSLLAVRLHVALAFAVVAIGTLLIRDQWAQSWQQPVVRRAAAFLAVLLFGQVLLGIEAGLSKLGLFAGPASWASIWVRSLHSVGGALVLAASLVLALHLQRYCSLTPPELPAIQQSAPLEQEHVA